jgi:hypothetical protein
MASLLNNPQHCIPQEIIADYTVPYPDLIKSVVSYALAEQHDFTTLYYGHPGANTRLLSWMPNIDIGGTYTSELVFESEAFSAALTKEPFVQPCSNGMRFRLTTVGRVSDVCSIKGRARHLTEQTDFSTTGKFDVLEVISTYSIFKDFVQAHKCEALQTLNQVVRAWNSDIWLAGKRFCTASDEDKAKWVDILNNDELQAEWVDQLAEYGESNTPFTDVLQCGYRLRFECRACVLDADYDLSSIGQRRIFCWMPEGGQVGDEVALIHGNSQSQTSLDM